MPSAARPLRGADKVAALLLAMGKPQAADLIKHFDATDIRKIARAAAELGAVPPTTLDQLVEEFAAQLATGSNLLGSTGEAEQLLAGVVPPEEIADIMSDLTGNSNHTLWERLSALSEATLAPYLTKEHPQAAALVLTKVSPACAAKVIGLLPRDFRNELMRRMVNTKPVSEPVMRLLETTLQEDLLSNVARNTGADSNARLADIINKMDREQMEDVLQNLAESRPKAAEVLKSLLFTFDDIVNLGPQARMVLFDQVPTERVVLALKGTDADFRNAILSSLAARARRIVENELTTSGAAPQREVVKARRFIADVALSLAERGEIELTAGDDGEEMFE